LASTAYDVTLGFGHNPANQIIGTTRSNDAYAYGGSANAALGYTVNGLNQVTAVSAGSVTYDARGNLVTTGSNTYGYSSENLLRTGPSSNVLYYDPLLRLFQINSTDRFGYDGQQMIGEYSTANVLARRYVFGSRTDEPLVWYEGSGTTDRRWLHSDERGSVMAVTNASGVAIGINSYDEYGVPASGNIGRFQYTGQAYIAEFGLYYYKARIYSSRLGRFMQADPIGYGDGLNWYNYVGGDSVNRTDPSGLKVTCTGSIVRHDSCGWGQGIVTIGGAWVPNGGGDNVSGGADGSDIVVVAGWHFESNAVFSTLFNFAEGIRGEIRNFACGIPSLDIGFGADLYAVLGGSLGGSVKVDIASGQIGVGGNVAVGVGVGVDAGPQAAVSPSGSGIVSANVTTSVGAGPGIGTVTATHNLFGTDAGQTSVGAGKAGTPMLFANVSAAIGFNTPSAYDLGCP